MEEGIGGKVRKGGGKRKEGEYRRRKGGRGREGVCQKLVTGTGLKEIYTQSIFIQVNLD